MRLIIDIDKEGMMTLTDSTDQILFKDMKRLLRAVKVRIEMYYRYLEKIGERKRPNS